MACTAAANVVGGQSCPSDDSDLGLQRSRHRTLTFQSRPTHQDYGSESDPKQR